MSNEINFNNFKMSGNWINLSDFSKQVNNDKNLIDIYKAFDKNGDNRLSRYEIASIFEAYKKHDINGDGALDKTESKAFAEQITNGLRSDCNKNNDDLKIKNNQEKINSFFDSIKSFLEPNTSTSSENSINNDNIVIAADAKPTIKINNLDEYFNKDGSLKSKTKIIEGTITIKDSKGNPVDMPLKIEPSTLDVMKGSFSHKDQSYNIIKNLTNAIANLPADLKSDLFNEITGIDIYRADFAPSSRGYFNRLSSQLSIGHSYSNGGAGVLNSGLDTELIAHELGHALDSLHGKYQSQDDNFKFKDKFNSLKKMLISNGIIKEGEEYFMKNESEFFAEYNVFDHGLNTNQKDKFKKLIQSIQNSNNEDIKNLYDSLVADYNTFIANSRSQGINERKGTSTAIYEKHLEELGSSLKANDESIDLLVPYKDVRNILNEDDFSEIFNSNYDLMKKYYYYLQNDQQYSDSNKVFAKYEKENSSEWQALKKGLQAMLLENIGYRA
ncbi:MAG: hypothetical protein ACI37Q_02445 [Candidatus Gastranaerophilaceae bacterium]